MATPRKPTKKPKRAQGKVVEKKWFFLMEDSNFFAGTVDGEMTYEVFKRGTKCLWAKPSKDDLIYMRKQHDAVGRRMMTVRLGGRKRFIEYEALLPKEEWEKRREKLYDEGTLRKESGGALDPVEG